MSAATTVPFVDRLDEVPGSLAAWDAELIVHLSDAQHRRSVRGDLLEIGTWYGRTSVLLGFLADADEQVQVCDLFEQVPPSEAGRREQEAGDGAVMRADFEATYQRFHSRPPLIHQCPSSELTEGALGTTFRFVHVDGSHVYESVLGDIALARSVLEKGGIVAFDDIVNLGHLGVVAAVWSAVVEGGFAPFACTPAKLYATPDEEDAATYAATVAHAAQEAGHEVRDNVVGSARIVATWSRPLGVRERAIRRVKRKLRPFVPWGVAAGQVALACT